MPRFSTLPQEQILFHKKSNYLLNKIIKRIDYSAENKKKLPQYFNINQNSQILNDKEKDKPEKIFEKNLWLVITESLLNKFPCPIDLKSFLLKCLQDYLKDERDVVNFAQINENYTEYLPNINKKNLDIFANRKDLFLIDDKNIKENEINENNQNEKNGDFSNSIKKIVRFIEEDERQKDKGLDKIIFLFINSNNFRKNDKDDDLFEILLESKVSVYCFCFDEPSEIKMEKMKKFLKYIPEGHLIIVKNYEVIERAFQNISFPEDNNKKKNLLTLKFSNHNFIH